MSDEEARCAVTREGNWQKLWPRLAAGTYVSEREAGEAAGLPEEEQAGALLELLRMTGLTVSAEVRHDGAAPHGGR